MCDYSLHDVASRPAKVGDVLVTSRFRGTSTRGFCAVDEPGVAVCLMPGTEIAFERDVVCERPLWLLPARQIRERVARFRHVNLDDPHTHHDALEFPSGAVILLNLLGRGQRATVLQLPVSPIIDQRTQSDHDRRAVNELSL